MKQRGDRSWSVGATLPSSGNNVQMAQNMHYSYRRYKNVQSDPKSKNIKIKMENMFLSVTIPMKLNKGKGACGIEIIIFSVFSSACPL